ncbi:TetR family transcriptional regulator, partial [Burkholderia pseudomallei]|nr:TetR family transcriptional regulator [Burkholderia pseudomallei]
DFHVCAFVKGGGEFERATDPIRVVVREQKARLLALVREQLDAHAAQAGADRRFVARLARQWLVLIDGAIGVALVSGDASAARDARAAAELLLDATLPNRSS